MMKAYKHPALRALCVVVFLSLMVCGCGRGGEYPRGPLVLVCPWSAGGGTDRLARQVAAQLEPELGVPVNVVNATGGGGVTGHTRGAMARPNGYTFAIMTAELNMLHWRGLTNITYRDYDPLMLINRDDAAVFVKADAPWGTLGKLKEAIELDPRGLKASGTAQGGIWHVALAGWLVSEGLRALDVIWVSINGAAPSLQELMAGGVDMVCCSLPEAQALLDAGEIRCLGLMGGKRLAAYPDTPTFKEQGADWSLGTWRGLGLPVGVSAACKTRLTEAVRRVVESDEYLDFTRKAGFNPAAESPAEFGGTLAALDEQFGAILTSEDFRGVQASRFGPMVFPGVLAGLLAASVAGLLATRRAKRPAHEPLTVQGLARMSMVVAWVALYVVFAEHAGFLLTAGTLLFVLLWRLEVRWYVALIVAAVLVPAAYQVFAVCLRVPLPLGSWWTG